jgi:hypothetical protein
MGTEGPKALFRGAGANILRGVASAAVLALYDKFQALMFGKVYSGGTIFKFVNKNVCSSSVRFTGSG